MARSNRRDSKAGSRAGKASAGKTDYTNATAADIARYGVRDAQRKNIETLDENDVLPKGTNDRGVQGEGFRAANPLTTRGDLTLALTDRLYDEESRALRRKVIFCVVVLVVLAYLSLGIMGAAGSTYGLRYEVVNPIEIARVIGERLYNFVAGPLPFIDPTNTSMYYREWPIYLALPSRAGVIGITLVCAVLLSISGMLYQNVFKNPIAGPGMLGISSGVSLGVMLVVYIYGSSASSHTLERYIFCYGFGAIILAFVILAGRKLSGKGRPFDIVTMLLIGSILSQLVGFVVQYVTLYVMDPDIYQIYLTVSQMLEVDTSALSWLCLGIVCAITLIPIFLLRFRLNALAFDEQEVKLLGINFTALRAVALILGALMILAAQIHVGTVAMVSLIVPFLSRSWFGCEFRKQLIGNVCISTILLLVCRDIVDLIPFVGGGIGIGSAVSVLALPLFLLIMAKHMRGWE